MEEKKSMLHCTPALRRLGCHRESLGPNCCRTPSHWASSLHNELSPVTNTRSQSQQSRSRNMQEWCKARKLITAHRTCLVACGRAGPLANNDVLEAQPRLGLLCFYAVQLGQAILITQQLIDLRCCACIYCSGWKLPARTTMSHDTARQSMHPTGQPKACSTHCF
jgi:hypothetical protein